MPNDAQQVRSRRPKFNLVAWFKGKARQGTQKQGQRQGVAPYQPISRGLKGGAKGYVFGVTLDECLQNASVRVSLRSVDGAKTAYGYVPLVVAQCGKYLKRNALEIQGIFRVSGSARRINVLQEKFEQPPTFGQDIDWTGFTVHDAASLLRRYLNALPTPVIPYQMYWDFNEVLSRKQSVLASISQFRALIALLPNSSRYLLQYLIDMLALFAAHSDKNLMTASNLAVVFQPGLVSSRSNNAQDLVGFPRMSGQKNDQEVLEFLVEHQKHFVFGLDSPESNEDEDNIEYDYEIIEAHHVPPLFKA